MPVILHGHRQRHWLSDPRVRAHDDFVDDEQIILGLDLDIARRGVPDSFRCLGLCKDPIERIGSLGRKGADVDSIVGGPVGMVAIVENLRSPAVKSLGVRSESIG